MLSHTNNSLQRAILAALAYHDVFDYPLTTEEVWKWLYVERDADREVVSRATPADVEWALVALVSSGKVDRAGIYHSLSGRSSIVATRMVRHAANERKWQRAHHVASILRIVPFVRFIGVVNTLALDNARPESDIDLFIIVKRRRLWITRAVVTALVQLLGLRRHGNSITDRVCLSFYVSDGALNLSSLKHPAMKRDSYLHYWVTQVVPLFSRGDAWQAFLYANKWITSCIPHGLVSVPMPHFDDHIVARVLRFLPESLGYSVIGDLLEYAAKIFQQRHILAKKGSRVHTHATDVVVNDDVLKFHEKDRRVEYQKAFQERFSGVFAST